MPANTPLLEQVARQIVGPDNALEHSGTGGFASTFKVTSPFGDVWAVKVVDAAQSGIERTQRELTALQAVSHPHIVGFRGHGSAEFGGVTYQYLEMEFVEGQSLFAALTARRAFTTVEAVDLVRQGVSGLRALWEAQTAHRDLSPSNLLLTPAGDLVIVDLGMARSLTDTTITTLPTPGTPGWMSPEQVGANPTHGDWRSDQFVLGLIAYRLVTGSNPFTYSNAYEAWVAPDQQRPRSPKLLDPSITSALSDLIDRMLQRQPHRRYLRPDALFNEVERVAATLAIADVTSSTTPQFVLIIGDKKSFAAQPGFIAGLAPERLVIEPRARARANEFMTLTAGGTTRRLVDPCTYLARSPLAHRPQYFCNLSFGLQPTLTGFASEAEREAFCTAALDHQLAEGVDEVLAPYFYAGNGEQAWITESLTCAAVTADLLTARAHERNGVLEQVWATVAVSQAWLATQTQRDTLLTLLTGASVEHLQLLIHTTQPSFGPLADHGVLAGIADVIAVLREAGVAVLLGRRSTEGLLGLALGATGWSTGVSGVQMNMSPHPEQSESGGPGYDRIYVPQLLTHVTTQTYVQFAAADQGRVRLATPASRSLLAANPALDSLTSQQRVELWQHNISAQRDQVTALAAENAAQRIPMMRTWVRDAATHLGALPAMNGPGESAAFLNAWQQVL